MSFTQVHDHTVGGECSKCGKCCGDFLPVKETEINKIKKYVQAHAIKECRHVIIGVPDMTCPFRDDKKKICTIYPVRPWICQQFMCNHTYEDIMKVKAEAFANMQIISMRSTFFDNDECLACVGEIASLFGGKRK